MVGQLIGFLRDNKDALTVLLSACALLVSTLALIRPSIKEWRDRRKAIFQALQEDRKAIAVVTLRVINGDWDSRLRVRRNFRRQLLQSLAIAVGLESSDRGKAYVLAALHHIANLDDRFRMEVIEHLEEVKTTFEAYAHTGADPKFEKERVPPLEAILKSLQAQTPAQQGAAPDGNSAALHCRR
jgi:hypothetical protein